MDAMMDWKVLIGRKAKDRGERCGVRGCVEFTPLRTGFPARSSRVQPGQTWSNQVMHLFIREILPCVVQIQKSTTDFPDFTDLEPHAFRQTQSGPVKPSQAQSNPVRPSQTQ